MDSRTPSRIRSVVGSVSIMIVNARAYNHEHRWSVALEDCVEGGGGGMVVAFDARQTRDTRTYAHMRARRAMSTTNSNTSNDTTLREGMAGTNS